ncbi:hypothetical protein [Haladaptatus sp.]|uniref:hypothetical protein n=1 Tax=Haladaptatus sp. TaxID=1973141 RepID=UPI003C387435
MTRVSQRTVLEKWLELEDRKGNTPSVAPDSLTERELLDQLLRVKPGVASFIWREKPISWYRLTLSRGSFENLLVVDGPDDMLWKALSPDGTILGGARRILNGDPAQLTAETGVDIDRILRFRRNPSDEPLVLVDRQNCRPPRVADGNHRATARALELLETDTYDPVQVYLARCSPPVLSPLRQRVCAVTRRSVGRRTW